VNARSINGSVSRRATLAGAGAFGLALAARGVAAQDATSDAMATHAIVGAWLVAPRSATGGYDTVLFGADGSVTQGFAASSVGPEGVSFSGPGLGIWAPIDERTVDFTAVSAMSDADGNSTGTLTVDGHLDISEDGNSWIDDSSASTVTIRDKSGAVIAAISDPTAPPVTAVRIQLKAPGFPEGTPAAATPAA
jgi:hypothetical protein